MTGKTDDRYADMINLEHPTSKRHRRMSASSRAAQFSPYAALTGYEAAVRETARLTGKKIELTESEKENLDEAMRLIRSMEEKEPLISVEYFQKDAVKEGGEYLKKTGRLRRTDEYRKQLIFSDGSIIDMDDVVKLCCDGFQGDGYENY